MKTYDVVRVSVEEYKSGPKAGQKKPVRMPDEAIPLGVISSFELAVYYLMPVKP